VLWKECNDPLLYLERRAYLGAIRDALADVEAARVVFAKARQRLERESGVSEPPKPRSTTLRGRRWPWFPLAGWSPKGRSSGTL
jgi:hypothetical protein